MIRISEDAYNALTAALRMVERDYDRNFSVYSKCTYGVEKPLEWQVNWSSIGAVDPEKAIQFAVDLQEFAGIANSLTRLELIIDYDKEGTIDSAEDFDFCVERVYKIIRYYSIDEMFAAKLESL